MDTEEAARLTMDPSSIPSPWVRMDPRTMRPVCLSDGLCTKGWHIEQTYTVPLGHVGVLRRVYQSIQGTGLAVTGTHPLTDLSEAPKITVGGRNIVLTSTPGGLFSQRITAMSSFVDPTTNRLEQFVEVLWAMPVIPLYEQEVVTISRTNDLWLGGSFEGTHLVEIWIGQPISMVRWLESAMPARARLGVPGAYMAGNGRE